jgi:hypothetical protein
MYNPYLPNYLPPRLFMKWIKYKLVHIEILVKQDNSHW